MSLVITSNTPKNEIGTTTDGINRSFSYVNHLQGTLEIPTDSQIAVQSVKINKTENIMLNESNTKFGFYYGRKASLWPDPDLATTIDITNNSLMIPAFITDRTDRDRNFALNTDDLADQIEKSFRKVLNCPNLCETNGVVGLENPGTKCIAVRNASQQGFSGFKWNIQETLSASSVKTSSKWENFNETGNDTAPGIAGTTISNPTTDEICVVGTEFPLSLNGGKFNCSLGNHKVVSTYPVPFSIGLSRCNGSVEDDTDLNQAPSYWEQTGTSPIFFDWRIACVINAAGKGEVRVFHSVATVNGDFEEVEFEYYNNKAGPRSQSGVLLWEDGEWDAVEFEIKNERVSIVLFQGGGDDVIICNGVSGGGDESNQTAKPVCPTTRWLFPKLIMAPGKNMGIISFSGVPVKDYVYGACEDLDWYNQRNCDDDIQECEILDKELTCDYNASDVLIVSDLLYSQVGLQGNFLNNEIRIVSAPSYDYFLGQTGLNTQFLFGFQRDSNTAPVSGDNGTAQGKIFQSSSIPELVSKQSIFVRVKNLPINSANFSKSAMSNILYHIPSFSNSGNETGSLHFEPSEMVYLDLNNTEPIYISTLEVDMVYGDETLATDLAGKTTVVFHTRRNR